jgi:hypothetical protein
MVPAGNGFKSQLFGNRDTWRTSNFGFEQQLPQVVMNEACFSYRGSIITTEDGISENTDESPVFRGSMKHNFNQSFKRITNTRCAASQEYCTCIIYKNCSGSGDLSRVNLSPNELSMELNKIASNPISLQDEIAFLDSNFLFPKTKKFGLFTKKQRKFSETEDKTERKVFNVWKIPKIAFSMVSREALARNHSKEYGCIEEGEEEVSHCNYTERKAAFGSKRDDLFYKTIGRDVRKFLQESFQSNLGGKSLKHILKNQTFYKEVQDFFQAEIVPRMSSSIDSKKVLWCFATLISYNGFMPYCDFHLSDISLKIHDSLHNFTKVKLINLCKLPEFKEVFKYYASKVSDSQFARFKEHRTMKTNVDGYKYAFNDILKQCK